MNEVPTVKSLISPDFLADLLYEEYGFDPPIDCRLVKTGDNDTYKITSNGEYFSLRISRPNRAHIKSDDELLFELEWLQFLWKKRIPVIIPLARSNGDLFSIISAPEGARYAVVFSWAKGENVLDVDQAGIFGKTIAKLHIVSNQFSSRRKRIHYDIPTLTGQGLSYLISFLKKRRPDDAKFVIDCANKAKGQVESLSPKGDEWGVIHGDLTEWNHSFTNDDLITLYDFDLCGYGWRAYDISSTYLCTGDADQWPAFLDGYESIRPLTYTERLTIPAFRILTLLWKLGFTASYPDADILLPDETLDVQFMRLRKWTSAQELKPI